MSIFKKNPFGHNLYIKKWLIRIFGWLTHRRFKGFNQLKIEGSEILNNLPENKVSVDIILNHHTQRYGVSV